MNFLASLNSYQPLFARNAHSKALQKFLYVFDGYLPRILPSNLEITNNKATATFNIMQCTKLMVECKVININTTSISISTIFTSPDDNTLLFAGEYNSITEAFQRREEYLAYFRTPRLGPTQEDSIAEAIRTNT